MVSCSCNVFGWKYLVLRLQFHARPLAGSIFRMREQHRQNQQVLNISLLIQAVPVASAIVHYYCGSTSTCAYRCRYLPFMERPPQTYCDIEEICSIKSSSIQKSASNRIVNPRIKCCHSSRHYISEDVNLGCEGQGHLS